MSVINVSNGGIWNDCMTGISKLCWLILKEDRQLNVDFLKDLNDKTKDTFGPVAKFSELMTQSVQDALKVQMESTKKYSEFTVGQFKALSEVRDTESLQKFFTEQMNAFGRLNEQMMSDIQSLAETGSKFREELEGIMNPSEPEVDKKATNAKASKAEPTMKTK